MRRALPKILVLATAALLVAGASAYALQIHIGNTIVSATAEILPRVLPEHSNAPVTVSSITRIKTDDGSPPPRLKKIVFIFDKHGSIETKGIPVCTLAKLAETTPAVARKRCAGSLVGEGTGRAQVNLPGQPPVEISSPLSFFNAAPVGGKPALIAHAYETIPVPKTLLVPITIEPIKHGRYGYQAEILMPEIGGGFGAATLAKATLGRTFKRGGKTVGYTNARCEGGRLQVHGTLTFAEGGFFQATLTSPCHSPS
jgi:hypothetical protein